MDESLIPSEDDDEPSVSPPRIVHVSKPESDTPPDRPIRLTPRYPDSLDHHHGAWEAEAMQANANRLSRARNNLHRKLNAAKDKRVVKC